MVKPSYPFPGVAAHFLGMFVAPFLMGQKLGSILLFLTGPGIALLFPGTKDGERSAIWCFVSIMESSITIFSQYFLARWLVKKQKAHQD
jgi:hypothetical protein